VAEKLTGTSETSDDPLDDFADERQPRDRAESTIPGTELRRFAEVVLKEKSALGAQALGWRFVARGNLKSADEWFQRSVGWEDNEGGVIGTAVIASRLKQNARLQSIKAKYLAHYPDLADFRVGSAWTPKQSSKPVKRARPARYAAKPAKPQNKTAEFWNRIEFK
jgi:cellulose synthase operon protein C